MKFNTYPYEFQNYNWLEQVFMSIFSGLTNFAFLFNAVYLFRKKHYFTFYSCIFTLICSFMYHFLQSVRVGVFIIDEGQWHKLDNIGSNLSFCLLFIKLANFTNENETHLNYISLIIHLFCQEADPWNIYYTIIPVLAFFVCSLINVYIYGPPKYNGAFRRGRWVLFIALFFFYKGLDEHSDYLRFYHGCWHLSVCYSSFYLWQGKEKEEEIVCFQDYIFGKKKESHKIP